MDCEGKWDNVYDNCLLSEIVSFSIDTDYVEVSIDLQSEI